MEWFRTYMEDYNTATMPHIKYYNLEKWEMDEYMRKQQEENERRKRKYESNEIGDDEIVDFNDERQRQRDIKLAREEAERLQFIELKQKMLHDNNKREEMRLQEILRNELQLAYKQGDIEKVKKLERRLAPDEERGR